MTDIEFVYWLNGFFEITNCSEVGPEQTKIIKEKLQSMFIKETGKPAPEAEKQEAKQEYPRTTIYGNSLLGDNTGVYDGNPILGGQAQTYPVFRGINVTNATVTPNLIMHSC